MRFFLVAEVLLMLSGARRSSSFSGVHISSKSQQQGNCRNDHHRRPTAIGWKELLHRPSSAIAINLQWRRHLVLHLINNRGGAPLLHYYDIPGSDPDTRAPSLSSNIVQRRGQPLDVKGDKLDAEETEKKPSILYRSYRVCTYPVRRVYRFIVSEKNVDKKKDSKKSKKKKLGDHKTTVKNIEEEREVVQENVNTELDAVKEKVKQKVVTSVSAESIEDSSSLSTPSESLPPATLSPRSLTAGPGIDLSGDWDLIVTDEFKDQYDKYLTLLGQPFFVRSVALSVVGLTTETTMQSDHGATLWIRGQNLGGTWERTLITTPPGTPLVTADGEQVLSEAWWEDGGQVHHSWMHGVEKYGGGAFESKRYLERHQDGEPDQTILVCESTFHPRDENREKARVTWRFQRKPLTS